MTANYAQHVSTRKTPQTQPIPGSAQVRNQAGGFSFAVDDWTRLERFLILGTEGGSYYASEHKMTVESASAVMRCIRKDGARVVKTVVAISTEGRAPKNTPALFVLALCAAADAPETRRLALEALPKVARIGTHLFQFVEFVQAFRGWGRGLRRAVGGWYQDKDADRLAYQMLKYKQREGWSHRDILRLTKPVPTNETHSALYRYATKGEVSTFAPEMVHRATELMQTDNPKRAIQLIRHYRLTREMVPTALLKRPDVWEALLAEMPMTAMIRNLATMTRVGLLQPFADATRVICERLRDETRLRKARVHPIALLAALNTYKGGKGVRSGGVWSPVKSITDALDDAFYLSFQNVPVTGLRWQLAVDVSASMGWGTIAGVAGLTPQIAAGAMSMITARTEPEHVITAFSTQLTQVDLSGRSSLSEVLNTLSRIPMGGTDCAQPMLWATKNRIPVDVFVVYTDSETWYGNIHPVQALKEYRNKMGIPAKLIVVGMLANKFSIADPDDAGMLDVVGFDTATPALMADFARV
jgi:60 kDa SS-A/Ro ribonucleoprotein